VTVNENAAEPPVEGEKDKEMNINSRELLGFEATDINKAWAEQACNDESVVFEKKVPEAEENASVAFRYRKYQLGETTMFIRCMINCAIQSNSGIPPEFNTISSDQPVAQTGFATTYALNEFDYRAVGAGGAFDWRKKLETQKGAVMATELKNNACKLSRWTMQSLLSGVDVMKIAFVSRSTTKDRKRHQILSTSTFIPDEFCDRIGLDPGNCWGIVKAISDLLLQKNDGRFILVRDPIRNALVLYQV
jgi:translation initiation factor 3 subunit D